MCGEFLIAADWKKKQNKQTKQKTKKECYILYKNRMTDLLHLF